jgi:hypothetical protein
LVQGWTLAVAGAALLASGIPAAGAAKPNLRATKVSKPPKTAVLGGSFRVKDTVANKGKGRAGKSATRFYLSADKRRDLGDLLMGGAREIDPLAGGDKSTPAKKRRAKVTVDLGTPLGEYFLLACADDREAVRESRRATTAAPRSARCA